MDVTALPGTPGSEIGKRTASPTACRSGTARRSSHVADTRQSVPKFVR